MTCRSSAVALVALLVGASLEAAVAVTWVKGAGGVNCDTVCAARDGCVEDAWPNDEAEFEAIAKDAGHTCEGVQEGGAKYDPSTDGRYCGWNGPTGSSATNDPRCTEVGDHSTYRICPCNADKEL